MRGIIQRVVQKNLIHSEREFMFAAECIQGIEFARVDIRSCRIVGMNDDDSPRPVRHRLLHGMKIHLPTVVVNERVRDQPHVLQISQKLEKRVARFRYQKLIASIAE